MNLFTELQSQYRISATMSVKRVSIGTYTAFMGVHCEYISDGTGRVNLWLAGSDEDKDVVFVHDARANWGGRKNTLVLNTQINGRWQRESHPSGFPFTPDVNVAVTAMSNVQDQVVSYANGDHIADYHIQGGASLGEIRGIKLLSEENKRPQLGIVAIGHVSVCIRVILLNPTE